MFYLLVIIIISSMLQQTESIREKPIRIKPTPSVVQIPPSIIVKTPDIEEDDKPKHEVVLKTPLPESESSDTDNVQVGQVIKTKTLTRVFHNYNKLQKDDDDDASMTEIELTPSENSDDYEDGKTKFCNDPFSRDDTNKTKTKKKKKKRKTFDDDLNITETINEVTNTMNETVQTIGKSVMMELVKKVVKSKQFTIVLIIGSITLGLGYLLKIVFWTK